jgi:hypothetical protein
VPLGEAVGGHGLPEFGALLLPAVGEELEVLGVDPDAALAEPGRVPHGEAFVEPPGLVAVFGVVVFGMVVFGVIVFGLVVFGVVVFGVVALPGAEVPGVVVPGVVVLGELDPGAVVLGVPFGDGAPGVVCVVPGCGVAVPAEGVAVPGAGVAAPGVEL